MQETWWGWTLIQKFDYCFKDVEGIEYDHIVAERVMAEDEDKEDEIAAERIMEEFNEQNEQVEELQQYLSIIV